MIVKSTLAGKFVIFMSQLCLESTAIAEAGGRASLSLLHSRRAKAGLAGFFCSRGTFCKGKLLLAARRSGSEKGRCSAHCRSTSTAGRSTSTAGGPQAGLVHRVNRASKFLVSEKQRGAFFFCFRKEGLRGCERGSHVALQSCMHCYKPLCLVSDNNRK